MAWCLHTPVVAARCPPVVSPTPRQWHAITPFGTPLNRAADLQALRSPAVILSDDWQPLTRGQTAVLLHFHPCATAPPGPTRAQRRSQTRGGEPIKRLFASCAASHAEPRLRASIAATRPRFGSILIRKVVVLSPYSKSFFAQFRYVITRIPCG